MATEKWSLEHVQSLVDEIKTSKPEETQTIWAKLRKQLDIKVGVFRKEQNVLATTLLEDIKKNQYDANIVLALMHLVVKYIYTRKGIDDVSAYIVEEMIAKTDGSADFQSWGLYFLENMGIGVDQEVWIDKKWRDNIFNALQSEHAKVRQWSVYLLGALAFQHRGNNKGKSYIADEDIYRDIKLKLIAEWKNQSDIFVLRQFIISLGQVGGYYVEFPDDVPLNHNSTTQIVGILSEAVQYRNELIREQVDDAIRNIIDVIFRIKDDELTDHHKNYFVALLNLTDTLVEQQLKYENYRNAIRAIESFADRILKEKEENHSGILIKTSVDKLWLFIEKDVHLGADDKPEQLQRRVVRAINTIGIRLKLRVLELQGNIDATPDPVSSHLSELLKEYSGVLDNDIIGKLKHHFAKSGKNMDSAVVSEIATTLKHVMHTHETNKNEHNSVAHYFTNFILKGDKSLMENAIVAIGSLGSDDALNPLIASYNKNTQVKKAQQDDDTVILPLTPAQEINIRQALIKLGGEAAAEALFTKRTLELVEETFTTPMNENRAEVLITLKDVRENIKKSLDSVRQGTRIALISGTITFLVALLSLISEQNPIVALGAIGISSIVTLVGLFRQLFYDPGSAVQRATAEATKVLTGYLSFVNQTSITGLAVIHEYTRGTPDADFLTKISTISSQAAQDAAVLYGDVGAWPDQAVKVRVPDFKGESLEEARKNAEAVGLKLLVNSGTPMSQPPEGDSVTVGHVLSQSENAGEFVDAGKTILVTLNSGGGNG